MTALMFSAEDAELASKKWRFDRHGYARRTLSIRPLVTIFAHHEVCLRAFGRRPNWYLREVCDHINRDKLDNRRENLRITSMSVNVRNSDRYDFSKCITLHKNGSFQVAYRGHYVGLFSSEDAAQRVVSILKLAEEWKSKEVS